MNKRIEEIRARIKNATPHNEWRLEPLEGKHYGTRVSIGDGEITLWTSSRNFEPSVREVASWPEDADRQDMLCDCHFENTQDYADALLISHAPADLLYLINELSEERKRRIEAEEVLRFYSDTKGEDDYGPCYSRGVGMSLPGKSARDYFKKWEGR